MTTAYAELIERLRGWATGDTTLCEDLREAADALAALTRERDELFALIPENIASNAEDQFWIKELDPVHGTIGRSMDSAEWSALTKQAWAVVSKIVAMRLSRTPSVRPGDAGVDPRGEAPAEKSAEPEQKLVDET